MANQIAIIDEVVSIINPAIGAIFGVLWFTGVRLRFCGRVRCFSCVGTQDKHLIAGGAFPERIYPT